LFGHTAFGQVLDDYSLNQDVCFGDTRGYRFEGLTGSTIFWSVEDGEVLDNGILVVDEDLITTGIQYSEVVVANGTIFESKIQIKWNVPAADYTVKAYEETTSFCSSKLFALTVTVNALPTADAGTDASIGDCSNTTLNGAGTGTGITYSWLPVTGLSDASISNPVASPATTTTYTLTVTGTYGCTATDQVIVTVDALPTADAGTGVTIGGCLKSTTLNGSGTGTGITYSWLPITGLDDATKANPIASPASTTTYTLTVTDTYGCAATNDVTVTVDALPTADAGTGVTIGGCLKSTTLNGSGTGTGIAYSWLPITGLDDATKANPIASPASTTIYTLTVTDTYGCAATNDVTVTVLPDVTFALQETQSILCNGDNAEVTITAGGGDGTYTYSNDGSNYQVSNVFDLPAGTHTLYVKDGNGCVASGSITINEPVALKTGLAIIASDICLGDEGIVTIENYETDVTYTLFVDGNPTASTAAPNGVNIDLIIDAAVLIAATDYTITIKAMKNSCVVDMDNSTMITVKPLPIMSEIE